ncbi:MAG TPA: hypothetical protein VFI23_02020 [Rhizomicrobium sp.]|nr:hypothetical protein [Rhizomicrobium sp.]
MAAFALLAFFFQSLAVQTHVHQQPASAIAKTVSIQKSGSAPLKSQDPVDQCRLCQELVHAGNFVTPSASVALASLSLVPAIFAALVSPRTSSAKTFTWQSRAPPVR